MILQAPKQKLSKDLFAHRVRGKVVNSKLLSLVLMPCVPNGPSGRTLLPVKTANVFEFAIVKRATNKVMNVMATLATQLVAKKESVSIQYAIVK